MGVSADMKYFKSFTGDPYYDKLIASKTINGYRAQIYEAREHSLYEINAFMVVAGQAFSVFLGTVAISPKIATALGIATFIKAGIEYMAQPYTILEYNATVHYLRDVDVNGRTCHQVQRRNVYRIFENDDLFTHEFQFGDEDPYFGGMFY